MLQMIFGRRSDGSVAPRTPRNRDGTPRVPDGIREFNLAQAVHAFHMGEAELTALYDELFGDLFPRLQDGEVGSFEPSPASVATTKRDILAAVRFPHLSPVEMDAVMSYCAERNLDPWRHVYAEASVVQGGRRELKFIVTIDALRSLADQTGMYRGQTSAYYLNSEGVWRKGPWTDKVNPPIAARVGIRRKGWKRPQFATARWDSYVQTIETPRGIEVSDFWIKMGPEQLAKCAEALAFKKTFPKALGSLLTREEMDQSRNPLRRPTSPRRASEAEVVIDDETPCSWREFEQLLSERFGIKTQGDRAAVIAKLREGLGGGNAPVLKTFFARALRALDECPELYGLPAMMPA
jgi:phage recombination protein Bet